MKFEREEYGEHRGVEYTLDAEGFVMVVIIEVENGDGDLIQFPLLTPALFLHTSTEEDEEPTQDGAT